MVATATATVFTAHIIKPILDNIFIDYYGSKTKLSQVATVLTNDATTITITPWEKNILGDIEKAIQTANIGINPVNDGEQIKLFFPAMTTEQRENSVKQGKSMSDKTKVAIRNHRKNANNKILVEETSSTATLDLGYWFESNTAAKKGFRIKYEITGGFPIYQNLENTAAPGLTFTKSTGFNFDTSLYMGYTLFRGFEMGVFANYSYMYREGETKTYNGQTVIWPTNITQSVRGGLQVTWKFD